MAGPMPVVVPLVPVMIVMIVMPVMMIVIKHRAQCDKCDRRCNNIMVMIRPGRRTGNGQGNQATNRQDPQLAGLPLLHVNLQFISTMAAM
jgi:hypothetical protein